MYRLGHLSDWHTTSPVGAPAHAYANKRFFGWLSWQMVRGRVYQPSVLRALFEDLAAQAPDHVAVTGDLTNLSLEHEFAHAAEWLAALGPPDRVSLVPGNHDAYVKMPRERSWDLWAPYLVSDGGVVSDDAGDSNGGGGPDASAEVVAPEGDGYPTLRLRGELALVGLCSAEATPLFRAGGKLGGAQLERLGTMLAELRERDLCRVILVHHPPLDHGQAPRRRLQDSAALRAVLARHGAELLLHGHLHRTVFAEVPGAESAVPCVGVRSASSAGPRAHRLSQYHVYCIERAEDTQSGRRFRIQATRRGYDPVSQRFVAAGEHTLSPG